MKQKLLVLLKLVSLAGLMVLPHLATAANTVTTPMRYAKEIYPLSSSVQLAQNSDCDEARNNADTCWSNWKNIGGGDDGQAGTFKQCFELYCKLLQAHGCNAPDVAACE